MPKPEPSSRHEAGSSSRTSRIRNAHQGGDRLIIVAAAATVVSVRSVEKIPCFPSVPGSKTGPVDASSEPRLARRASMRSIHALSAAETRPAMVAASALRSGFVAGSRVAASRRERHRELRPDGERGAAEIVDGGVHRGGVRVPSASGYAVNGGYTSPLYGGR